MKTSRQPNAICTSVRRLSRAPFACSTVLDRRGQWRPDGDEPDANARVPDSIGKNGGGGGSRTLATQSP